LHFFHFIGGIRGDFGMGNKDMAWYFGDANAWGIEIHAWSNHMAYM